MTRPRIRTGPGGRSACTSARHLNESAQLIRPLHHLPGPGALRYHKRRRRHRSARPRSLAGSVREARSSPADEKNFHVEWRPAIGLGPEEVQADLGAGPARNACRHLPKSVIHGYVWKGLTL